MMMTLMLALALVQEATLPQELLRSGISRREAGDSEGALLTFSTILSTVADPAVREAAHFERAATYYKIGAYWEAYHDFEAFILRFPQSPRVTDAKRLEMTSALNLARVGKSTFMGLMTSDKAGIDALNDALRRYPREDFSPDFTQKLGMFHYDREDYDLAAEVFTRVLDLYGDSSDAVLALYMLGRTAEVRFDSIDKDIKPLRDARRHYERFLEEAERMRRLPDPARRNVDGLIRVVQERLTTVYERMLAKQLMTAEYYDWKGLPRSSRLYYEAILKEEASFRRILPAFPDTEGTKKARERLAEMKSLPK
mgnify:CR=1 FL=1